MNISSRRLVPATVLAVLASLLLAVPAQAADTGTISGTVTARPAGGSASAYDGASVVFDRQTPDGTVSTSVETEANGSFTATLPNGTYEIRTYPQEYGELGQYGYEYYDDRWSPYGATEVVVNGGAITLPHTIELRPIGKVAGTVRNEAGQPMPGVYVYFSQGDGGGYSTVTDAQGRYDSLDGEWSDNLIPGDYDVEAGTSGGGIDDPQYYYDTHPVTVSPGVATTQDITMRERPRVVFTVLDTDGAPLANAPLIFKVRNDGGAWGSPQYGPNETDAQGRYRFIDNFDEFKIQFGLPEGYQGTAVPEYWDNAYTFEDATVLAFPDDVARSRHFTVQLGPAPVVDPPTITPGAPTISGSPRTGRALTARPGTWSPAGVTLSYQWLADGAAIAGATAATYKPTNAQAGRRLSVRVTGALAGATSKVATSSATAPVIGELRTARPRVAGAARLAKKLTASVQAWAPAKVKLTFQWLRDGKALKGRTARTYRLVKADLGHRISVRVTGRKASYATATATSRATAKVRR